jgi:hypothetical protein
MVGHASFIREDTSGPSEKEIERVGQNLKVTQDNFGYKRRT